MTLTEFLLARIAEDEAWQAEHAHFADAPDYVPPWWKRVDRECESKRSVITAALWAAAAVDNEGCCHSEFDIGSETEPCRHMPPPPGVTWGNHPEPYDTHPIYSGCHGVPVARAILAPLAAVYSDHPDYLPEWQPVAVTE